METVLALIVGLGTGVLSGVFGVGGGLILTPLLILVLGVEGLTAVATPMLVILPTTITGAISHLRKHNVEVRIALISGFAGAVTSYIGAIAAENVGDSIVVIITGVVLVVSAVSIFRQSKKDPIDPATGEDIETEIEEGDAPAGVVVPKPIGDDSTHRAGTIPLILAGVVAGFGSGFLGVGGGFLLVPLYVSIFGLSMKRAAGTSLLAITIISIPGLLEHMALGNVDIKLGLILAVGAIPGAIIGAKIGLGAKERTMRIGFGILMVVAGLILAATELDLF